MEFHFKKDPEFSENCFAHLINKEWLETNGLGGYSSSSVFNNCHTRKYHGFLVSNLENLKGKYVLLSKVDDFLIVDEEEKPLTAHKFDGILKGESFDYYKEFILKTHPVFIYQFKDIIISKEILMPFQEDTILIKYKILSKLEHNNLKIMLNPLIAYRNFHALTKENSHIKNNTEDCINGKKTTPYEGMPTLFLQISQDFEFTQNPIWYKNFSYDKERERGFESNEDLFSLGKFILPFDSEQEIIFSASLVEDNGNLSDKWLGELKRRNTIYIKHKGSQLQRQLKKASLSFIQKDPKTEDLSIIAGYHWFLQWGRDAMISLPGLTLHSGLEKECLKILHHFSKYEKNGLIPNFLGATIEETAYNTVDASLWFSWAIQQYYLKTKDLKHIETLLWPTLKNIYRNYKNGTSYGIKMDADGLICVDHENANNDVNITWMDAMVDGKPVTPRHGLQVEINALWYNMLCFMGKLAVQFGDQNISNELETLASQTKTAFRKTFWDEKLGYLKDFVNPTNLNDKASISIRPNQIIAASLPYSPLSPKMMIKVVNTVRKHLLTPYGLRTLSPEDPNYIGIYAGGPKERDSAYHNGTVWPWLLSHFTESLLKILQNKKAVAKIIGPCLRSLNKHLNEAGIGSVSEIFSGDEPHNPDGCISQAWSVSEILRTAYLIDYK